MSKLKTLLAFLLAIPLVLFGRVEDPFVGGGEDE